jgi:hypothetical protein
MSYVGSKATAKSVRCNVGWDERKETCRKGSSYRGSQPSESPGAHHNLPIGREGRRTEASQAKGRRFLMPN